MNYGNRKSGLIVYKTDNTIKHYIRKTILSSVHQTCNFIAKWIELVRYNKIPKMTVLKCHLDQIIIISFYSIIN